MNYKRIIIIVIVFYIVALVATYFGITSFIKAKDSRLREEIFHSIDKMFDENYCLVDVYYHNENVVSEQMKIPESPKINKESQLSGLNYEKRYSVWKEKYGDVYKLYKINNNDSDVWPCHQDGWNLIELSKGHTSSMAGREYEIWNEKIPGPQISISWYFPYAVGFLKQEYSFLYSYMPSVKTAVEEAFEFFTTNPMSLFISERNKDDFISYNGKLDIGCYDRIFSAIYASENDYYCIQKDKNPDGWQMGTPLFNDYSSGNERERPLEFTYMHNGYYRVFVGKTQPQTWSVYRNSWHPEITERKKLMLWWGIGWTIFMLAAVIPLAVLHNRREKMANLGMQDRLKLLCNPANFVDKYDKVKVKKANEIFKQLQTPNLSNDELIEMQAEAVKYLGIKVIDDYRLSTLKKKVNPKNYMQPYDPEKVSLANELFSIINKEGLTYEEFVEIERESKKLSQ